MHGFLQETVNIAFSVVPRIGDGDVKLKQSLSLIWSSVLAYVCHHMLLCFFFLLGFTFKTLHDLLKVIIVFVRLFALP